MSLSILDDWEALWHKGLEAIVPVLAPQTGTVLGSNVPVLVPKTGTILRVESEVSLSKLAGILSNDIVNRSFQTVSKQEGAMNTQNRRHDIYPYRHARAILMCLTLLNSFNHMKSFTTFIFSWLKFVKKRGTSIYLLRVYVMPSILCIHCTFLLWHCL